jgi:septal ring factor EnvC (AmiA/AmiB activator)
LFRHAQRNRRRRSLVAGIAVVTVVALGAGAASAGPPAPFPMPLDSGTRYVQQAADARSTLANAQPAIARTEQRRVALEQELAGLNARLADLEAQVVAAQAQVDAARARIASVAAKQYMGAGGTRVNAAIEAAMNADDILELGRNLHILEKSGTHEIDAFHYIDGVRAALVQQADAVRAERDDTADAVEDAIARVEELQASLAGARRLLAEAQDGIARFHRAATTAGSPIMGPSLLSAGELAAFVRSRGGRPRLTVSLDALAQMYIEEGNKVGVRGDVAFAQSILETGWFEFARSMVEPSDNNFAGVGACDTCERGFAFSSARLGVRAQVQLLRVYVDPDAGRDSFPDALLLPGTLRLGFRGRVQTWWDLTGRWATASDYGNAVYAVYNRMVRASGYR